MFVVIVTAHVKEEYIHSFIEATIDNASHSINEPGVARFDFYQQVDDPSKFTLLEIYRSEDAPTLHRETNHYIRWKDAVEVMMVEPRTKTTNHILHAPQLEM